MKHSPVMPDFMSATMSSHMQTKSWNGWHDKYNYQYPVNYKNSFTFPVLLRDKGHYFIEMDDNNCKEMEFNDDS